MADNVTLNPGASGSVVSTDEVTRATIVQHVQYVKLMNGTDAAIDVIPGEATNGLDVDVTRVQGTVTVDGSGVTQPVSNAGLTELAAAINASSQMDVNIAASGATLTVASHAVTNAGTFATQVDGSALTALQLIDNLVLAEDAAHVTSDPGIQALAVRKATPANVSSTDGDYEPLQINAGRLWASATIDAAIPAGTNNIGDVDILSIAAGDNNIGNVDVVTLPNVTLAAGTNTNEVVGDVAHDAAASGNPVLVAASAETMADSAPANRVSADADATRFSATDGAMFVIPCGPQTWSYHVNGSSALTDASVHAAPGAGLSLYVSDIVVSSGAATAMNAFFEEGASTVLGPYYLEAVAGRGCVIHFQTPKKITANTALTITTSAAIAHSVDVTGFIAPG